MRHRATARLVDLLRAQMNVRNESAVVFKIHRLSGVPAAYNCSSKRFTNFNNALIRGTEEMLPSCSGVSASGLNTSQSLKSQQKKREGGGIITLQDWVARLEHMLLLRLKLLPQFSLNCNARKENK